MSLDHEARPSVTHQPSNSELSTDTSAESTPNNRRRMLIGAGTVASVLAAGGLWLGLGHNNSSDDKGPAPDRPVATAPANPSETASVPAEARQFVDAYPGKYQDPVATYYSEKAYLQEHPTDGGVVLDESWIDSYEFTDGISSETSPIGFGFIKLPFSSEASNETAVNLFNQEDTMHCINRYMNLVAKNPSAKEVAVIDAEFLKYCGAGNTERANNLLSALKEVVATNGSAANYTMSPAVENADDQSHTTFGRDGGAPIIDGVDKNGNVVAFSDRARLVINVDSYDDHGTKQTTQQYIEDVPFSVSRFAPMGPTDPGIVGIGLKTN